LVGQTLDDAAGETFDKVAKMLGLGYPGGPHIDRAAQGGDPHAWAFPRPMLHKGYDFSFSGLKTACRQALASTNPAYMQKPAVLADFCASFQQTVVDVVLEKLFKAAVDYKRTAVTIGGGVAANSVLRAGVVERAAQYGIEAFVPARRLCTDNGWMIAAAGARRLLAGERDDYRLQPLARWPVAAVMVQEVLG
jgi:N6-L-threonylcarbamoyladenine synthase